LAEIDFYSRMRYESRDDVVRLLWHTGLLSIDHHAYLTVLDKRRYRQYGRIHLCARIGKEIMRGR
jgi:hypothetical protein